MATKIISSQRNGQAARPASARSTQLTPAQREQVARTAYQLWLDGGCRHGHDSEDWAKAEAIVLSKLS